MKAQEQKEKARGYNKVSDEQRALLIDLMSHCDQIKIREASEFLCIKYESAKSIWRIFKKSGRMHNTKTKKQQHSNGGANQMQAASTNKSLQDRATLYSFDRSSEQLRQSMFECRTKETGNFQAKPLNLQKQEAQESLQLSNESKCFGVTRKCFEAGPKIEQ